MTERRFYQVRWRPVFRFDHMDCGHRHKSLTRAQGCAKKIGKHGRWSMPPPVVQVTERRRIVWEPTYSRVEDAP